MVAFTPSTAEMPEAKEHFYPFEEDRRGAEAYRRLAEEDPNGG
jgi:hypothetical protein